MPSAHEYMRDNPPPRQALLPRQVEAIRQLIVDIQILERRAYELGAVMTAQDLNKAMNRAGFELADQL